MRERERERERERSLYSERDRLRERGGRGARSKRERENRCVCVCLCARACVCVYICVRERERERERERSETARRERDKEEKRQRDRRKETNRGKAEVGGGRGVATESQGQLIKGENVGQPRGGINGIRSPLCPGTGDPDSWRTCQLKSSRGGIIKPCRRVPDPKLICGRCHLPPTGTRAGSTQSCRLRILGLLGWVASSEESVVVVTLPCH